MTSEPEDNEVEIIESKTTFPRPNLPCLTVDDLDDDVQQWSDERLDRTSSNIPITLRNDSTESLSQCFTPTDAVMSTPKKKSCPEAPRSLQRHVPRYSTPPSSHKRGPQPHQLAGSMSPHSPPPCKALNFNSQDTDCGSDSPNSINSSPLTKPFSTHHPSARANLFQTASFYERGRRPSASWHTSSNRRLSVGPTASRRRGASPGTPPLVIKCNTNLLFHAGDEKDRIVKNKPEVLRYNYLPSFFVNTYQELSTLGTGSFGTVRLCKNRLDGNVYAIKKNIQPFVTQSDLYKHLHEVFAISKLDHPSIVRYYNSWIEPVSIDNSEKGGYSLYCVMGYCDGQSVGKKFRQKLANNLRFSEEECLKILRSMASALAYLHGKGLAHLDIRAENIYCHRDNYVLGDFGLVRRLDSHDIREGDNKMLAAELLDDDLRFLDKSDIFSLGACIYSLARGEELASKGDEWRELRHDNIPPLPQNFSDKFYELICRMMHSNPKKRPSAYDILCHEFFISKKKEEFIAKVRAEEKRKFAEEKRLWAEEKRKLERKLEEEIKKNKRYKEPHGCSGRKRSRPSHSGHFSFPSPKRSCSTPVDLMEYSSSPARDVIDCC